MITDGGPFRRKMPNRIGRWLSLVGTGMGNTECHSAAYDPVTDRYGCGLQDQDLLGNPTTLNKYGPTWYVSWPGFDRYFTNIDNKMHASASDTICAYSGADSFKYADFYRRFSVNRFNNSQFLIVHRGNTTVFLSNRYMDEGSFVPVSPPFDNAPWYKPLSDVDNVYDAFLGGVVNGKNNNAVWWAYLYQALMLRDQAVFAGKAILVDHPLLSGHGITAMAVDPNNFRRVCIAGGGPPQDKIYCSLSGSIGKATSAQLANYGKAPVVQWSDVTGNFASLVGSRPKSLAQVVKMIWISKAATTPAPWTNVVVASTGMGLVWMNLAAPGAWTLFPAWLPPVPIVTVKHVASKDMIYVATLGRGVWSLNGISNLAFD